MLLWIGPGLIAAAIVPYVIFLAGINIGKKLDEPPALTEDPKISIVISAYNEEAVIQERVKNILESSYPSDRYEVIFVDDCSSDNTKRCQRGLRAGRHHLPDHCKYRAPGLTVVP